MKRQFAISLLLACLLISSGCASIVVGAGAAAGIAATNVAGKDTRRYDAEYHLAARACLETLATLMITVYATEANESATTIRARHADQTPVEIDVVPSGPGQSTIGVRTGLLGIMGLEASAEFHAALKKRLGRKDQGPAGETTPEKQGSGPMQPAVPSTEQGRSLDTPSSIAVRRKVPPELTIYFKRDSNELLPTESSKLDKLAATMIDQPQMELTLNGYADAVGSADYNLMVAASRASSVKAYLVSRGVDPLRVAVVGKGARDFAAGNDSEEDRSLNRRVEIIMRLTN